MCRVQCTTHCIECLKGLRSEESSLAEGSLPLYPGPLTPMFVACNTKMEKQLMLPRYQTMCPTSDILSVPQDDVVCCSQVKESLRGNKYVALKVAKDR